MGFIAQPSPSLCDIGPGADICEALRQRIYVTIMTINARYLERKPAFIDMTELVQICIDPRQQGCVLARTYTTEIWNATEMKNE